MYTNELKAIETLISNLLFGEQKSEISNNTRVNLFNTISIHTILDLYRPNTSFDQDSFLENGIIEGIYDSRVKTPDFDLRYSKDPNKFYKALVDALKTGEYTFDEESNVFVASENLETVVPCEWLYRLAEGLRRERFQTYYLFNKYFTNGITDENSLIEYLRTTKFFELTIYGGEQKDISADFNVASNTVTQKNKDKREIKVDELIAELKAILEKKYEVSTAKNNNLDTMYFVRRANKNATNFYSEPLKRQKQLINDWFVEYSNCNDYNFAFVQKMLLKKDLSSLTEEDKNKILCGLLVLYFRIIESFDLDYNMVSLSSINITTYINSILEANMISASELSKKIAEDKDNPQVQELKEKIRTLLGEIKSLDGRKDRELLEKKSQKLQALINKYYGIETEINREIAENNSVQNIIRYQSSNAIEEIAFDNPKIVGLLIKSAKGGRISISTLDNKTVRIELFTKEVGLKTFACEATPEALLEVIENIDSIYFEYGYKLG